MSTKSKCCNAEIGRIIGKDDIGFCKECMCDHPIPNDTTPAGKDLHTPLPWKVGEDLYLKSPTTPGISVFPGHATHGYKGPIICRVSSGENRTPEDDANAAYIVEACNAYPGLKAENQQMRSALEPFAAILKDPEQWARKTKFHCIPIEDIIRAQAALHPSGAGEGKA